MAEKLTDNTFREVYKLSNETPFKISDIKEATYNLRKNFMLAEIKFIEIMQVGLCCDMRKWYHKWKDLEERGLTHRWGFVARILYWRAEGCEHKYYSSFCQYKRNKTRLKRIQKKLTDLKNEYKQ